MTPEEFAAHVEALLDEADDGGLPIQDQVAVLERIAEAMREALT